MSDHDVRVEWLEVGGDVEVWRSIGFTVADDGTVPLIGTSIRVAGGGAGMTGWALSSAPTTAAEIDGLATVHVEPPTPTFAAHELGATALDHVVVLTNGLERTSEAIAAATGCELKRIREVGDMRQGFHRIGRGGLIVELVERPDVPAGPATFWGLVVNVDDLDAAYELLGPERISTPKDAVQPGRRIATIRGDVGLGLPVALMSV